MEKFSLSKKSFKNSIANLDKSCKIEKFYENCKDSNENNFKEKLWNFRES